MSVTEWPPGEAFPGPATDGTELRWPLDREDLDELRWYLEDYLQAPFGVYGDRGRAVERRLPAWGAAVFATLFGAGPGRDAYLRARARGDRLEIVLRSESAELLGLPWELMADPARPSPLVLEGVAVSRRLSTTALGKVFEAGGSRLRVLMVIARPDGTEDVGFRMIARPLLRRLEAVRGEVDLVVLRPPTLARLGEVLAEARAEGRPFQIVHFDGHGVFGEEAPDEQPVVRLDPLRFDGPGPRGMLVFEQEGGGPDLVSAERVARVLADARVPLVVLNACQSAAMASQVEAAVATRLLQEGAAAVIAMAYSVYAVAAAEFMTAFYDRLFAGDRVAEAVAAGRRRLAVHNGRPSPKGPLPLADWVVPVLYTRSEVALPGLRGTGGADPAPRPANPGQGPSGPDGRGGPDAAARDDLASVGEFVGRDGLLFRLDVGARLRGVVVLHGPGGAGKTELAKAFGRWYGETGGADGARSVVWHSFEPGASSFRLANVIDRVGRQLLGAERFDPLGPEERREAVERELATRRALLIWDNVESVYSMPYPGGATPVLAEAELAELRAFLERVARGGPSAVVLTSRTPEDWLGPQPLRIGVTGLDPGEASEYAERILAAYPGARRRREQRAFGELMNWLGGHPLSMRLVLPHLDERDPGQVLAALVEGEARLLGDAGGARAASLAASIAYSLAHLPDADRRALSAVALFHGSVDLKVLDIFSADPALPARFQDRSYEDWRRLLRRAAGIGLLTETSSGAVFLIHPALPPHLSAQWRAEEPDYAAQHETALRTLINTQAGYCEYVRAKSEGTNAALAMAVVGAQRRTVATLFGQALERGLWGQALAIVRPLDDYWDARGLYEEASGWVDHARLVLERADGSPPPLDSPAGVLWAFLVSTEASRLRQTGRTDDAERIVRTFHRAAEALPPGPGRLHALAQCYQNLGSLAMARARWTDSERWYRRCLEASSRLGYAAQVASCLHQLGLIASARGRMTEAEEWFLKALSGFEGRGDRLAEAQCCLSLGTVAQQQGRFEDARGWYGRTRSRAEELGHWPLLLSVCHQYATMDTDLGWLEEAEEWCRQALLLSESLGHPPNTAGVHHQLGVIASMRNRLEEAKAWHLKALEIREALGDPHGTADSHHQLGIVATQRGELEEAVEWYTRSREVREEIGDHAGLTVTYHQLGLTAQTGGRLTEAEDWYRRELALCEQLGDVPGTARTCTMYGQLAEEQGKPGEALEWLVRAVTCFEEFPHPLAWQAAHSLKLLTRDHGVPALERAWRSVTGRRLPAAVRAHLRS
ncbi:tetratricopeptide repeat protein [Kitasatospora sp. NPDC057500]|uniref:CHAT domain-containing tetratricopeptide repeat protein n=1 Tax=Kitasatospora sp. NPDC057500 TaxID=3346151 RepID=UPI0036D04CA9